MRNTLKYSDQGFVLILFTHLTIPSLVAAKIFVLGAGIATIAANGKASFACE
jgi:hypothetical protein